MRSSQPRWEENWDRPLTAWLSHWLKQDLVDNASSGTERRIWGAFSPLRDEPPILATLRGLSQIDWVFPRMNGESLQFCRVDAGAWVKGPFALEPGPNCLSVANSQIQGLLIPALAFDKRGYRLGRGGGHYDRFLKTYQGVRVGVIHSSRYLERLPADEWDQPVEWIATEHSVQAAQSGAR